MACSREAVGGSEGEGSISVWEPVCGCRAAAHARGKALEQTEGGCKDSVVGTVVSWAAIGGPVGCGRRLGRTLGAKQYLPPICFSRDATG